MKLRCGNASNRCYGGKGIAVCSEWLDFPPFLEWALANGWAPDLTIERKDNALSYSPQNCRWATRAEQSRNRAFKIMVTIDGRTKSLYAWSQESESFFTTIYKRYAKGIRGKALIAPPRRRRLLI